MFSRAANWFYGETQPQVDDQVDVADLDTQLDFLKLKQQDIEFDIGEIQKKAKSAYRNGDKAKAGRLLQQKKQLDLRVTQLSGQINNLEHTRMTMDSTAVAVDMVATMQQSTAVMKRQMNGFDSADVAEIRDDLNTLTMDAMDISNVLADPFTVVGDMTDVDAQMAEWDDEIKTSEMDLVSDQMPEAPTRQFTRNNGGDNNNNLIKNE